MQEELLQFQLQKVWTLVNLPNGKRAIGTKWVFRNKKDKRGIVVRNKARLIAQGYTQEEGIDYDEVFAPVARIETIRLFLAYVSFMGFIVYQMDVRCVFLYGTIEEEGYVCQPHSFEDPQFPNKVYKVEKALYGLHQAPKAWYETLSTYLIENGFRRGTIDKTLFIKKDKGDILLVHVYINDIIFGSTKKSLCDKFEGLMHKRFQMSSMGELTFFLGLQVQQKKDGIFNSQDKYVADILKKFYFATVKTTSTPMELNKALIKDEEAESVDVHLYRSMIGSLMYLTASRPDIMFVVCACARFQVTPKMSHLHAVKMIFRYLKGQPKLGLWKRISVKRTKNEAKNDNRARNEKAKSQKVKKVKVKVNPDKVNGQSRSYSPFDLEAFSDSDYAGASLDRESIIGGCQFLGKRLISWQCKKQTLVANSTTEAEYVAAANCCGQFVDQHNMVACLEKTEENAEFHQIVDFLSTCSINYALTVSPTIYASYIEQFWNTATSKTVNSVKQIHAIVDGKAVVISESSVRSDLLFNDEDGIACLTNDEIFENLALMGYEQLSTKLTFQKGSFSPQWKFLIHTILHCISSKSTAWNEFSTNLASAVICLAKGQKFNFSKLIFDGMLRNLDPKRFLMYPRFLQLFLNNQLKDLPEPFNDTYETPTHNKKVFSNMARKSKKISGKATPLFDSMLVQNQAHEGEGSAIPPKPQPTPSTSQPNGSEPQTESLQTETPLTVSHELQTEAHIEQILPSPSTYQRIQRKTQKHRRAKKVTGLPQTSVHLDHGVDEEISSGDRPRHGEDSMEYHDDLTDFVPPTPHDLPLSGGNTLGSDEGRMELIHELMETCTSLTKRVLTLEEAKTTQDRVITRLKLRVKRLEKKRKERTPQRMKRRLFKGCVETSTDKSLGEDASKHGRNDDNIVELNLTDRTDTEVIMEHKGSSEKGGSTADQVSTTRKEVSAASVLVNTLVKMRSEKAKEKEKGVVLIDEEEPPRLNRSTTTLQPLPTIDPKDKELAQRLHEEELAELDRAQKERQKQEEATSAALAEEFDEI
ncbi:putative ribonuclease H-like domain-containing protein [Tanacetum coccineum]